MKQFIRGVVRSLRNIIKKLKNKNMKLLWNKELITKALLTLDINTIENMLNDFSSNRHWERVKLDSDKEEQKIAAEMMHAIAGEIYMDYYKEINK